MVSWPVMAKTKEEYAERLKGWVERLEAGECAECPCPKTKCYWHGNCRDCVRIHRMQGNHLPNCLQFITKDQIKALAESVEMETTDKPRRPNEFYEHAEKKLSE